MDFLGIPGLLEPDQVRDLLRQRQDTRRSKRATQPEIADERSDDPATFEELGILRRELNGLVSAWNHRTGQPHAQIHTKLRKECGGPATAAASARQLQERIDRLREWAARPSA